MKTLKKAILTLIADLHPKLYEYLRGIENIESKSHRNYLIYMAQRLIELKRVLKSKGSIYLHCDNTMSHYLKLLMDCIFDHQNFRNQIIWGYRTGGISKRYFPRKYDLILFYGKSNETYFKPIQETIYYNKPFFTDNKANEEGKYPVNVYIRDILG